MQFQLQSPTDVFLRVEIDILILKCIWEHKTENRLVFKKNDVGGPTLLDFKHKATEFKTVWYGHKENRQDQWKV